MSIMRAKLMVTAIETPYANCEVLKMMPVTSKPFDADGFSEDNAYSRWTPSGSLELSITNPALHGKFKVGQKFYVDFTEATE